MIRITRDSRAKLTSRAFLGENVNHFGIVENSLSAWFARESRGISNLDLMQLSIIFQIHTSLSHFSSTAMAYILRGVATIDPTAYHI